MAPDPAAVDRALHAAIVATADAVRDVPQADAAARLQVALDGYRSASDAWRDAALAAVRERARRRRAAPATS